MPYVLPTPEPQRHWYNDVGESQGITANLLIKALLAQMGAGGGPFAPKNIPNPNYGAMTNTNQLNPGVTFQRGATPPLSPQARPAMGTPAPYSGMPRINQWQFKNLADTQAMQYQKAQIADLQAKTATYTPEFQANLLRAAQGLYPISPTNSSDSSGEFVDALRKLAPLADDSNPDPVSRQKARERISLFRQLAESPL